MIALYGFGAMFGLPDGSPFVIKTELQLKLAGIAYEKARASPRDAPKGKLPFIRDGEQVVGDSTLIRRHIEETRGIDLEAGLDQKERAAAWAIERLLEDHLYWAMLALRWGDDANFAKGPSQFFAGLAEPARQERRARFRETIRAQGIGRHAPNEIAAFGERSLAALSALLGDRPYLFGATPSAADATLYAFFASTAAPFFEGSLARAARAKANLMDHAECLRRRYFPEFAPLR